MGTDTRVEFSSPSKKADSLVLVHRGKGSRCLQWENILMRGSFLIWRTGSEGKLFLRGRGRGNTETYFR